MMQAKSGAGKAAGSRGGERGGAEAVHRRRWAILAVLCLSVFLAVVDNTIVNVALPTISRRLQATTSELQWIVDAYSLVFAAVLLVGGSLGDRFGRKGALQVGLVAFAGFSALAGLSGGIDLLIIARCLMGLAAALVFPATLAILTNTFTDPRERAGAVGAWTGVVGLAVALGPLTGGVLLQHFAWGSVFFVNLPIVAVALGFGAWLLPTSRDPAAPRLDLVGFVLSIAGVAGLVYTTIEAPGRGWTALITLAGYVASLVVVVAFAAWERRVAEPMLDVRLFANVRFTAASSSIAVAFFGLFGFIFLITQYFQAVKGYSTLSAGVRTLPFALVIGALAPVAVRVAQRFGTTVVVSGGLVLMSAGFGLAGTATVGSSYFGLIVSSMVLMAAGLGLIAGPATEAIMGSLPLHQAGAGSAVNDTTREVGGTLGVAVMGSVLAAIYADKVSSSLHGRPWRGEPVGDGRTGGRRPKR